MKKIKFAALFAVLLASLSISSCSSDDSGESIGTSTGDYWPMAVNNQWTFEQDGVLVEPLEITGTDVFSGTTYYRLSNPFSGDELGFDAQVWIAKKGGTYYQKTGDINFTQDGITIKIKGWNIPMFKDYLDVNETWKGSTSSKVTYTYGFESASTTMTIKYSGTILEKGVTEIINGETYSDVIKAKVMIEISIEDEQITAETETWYANGVGPIKDSETVDGETTERILVDYSLN